MIIPLGAPIAGGGPLPAEYLAPGEKLLFEVRPSFLGYVIPAVVGGTLALTAFLFCLYFLGPLIGPDAEYAIAAVAVMLLFLATVVRVVSWKMTSYALSTSRCFVKVGSYTRSIVDIPLSAIQSTALFETAWGRTIKYGTIIIASGAHVYGAAPLRPGVIYWTAIPDPLRARAQLEGARVLAGEPPCPGNAK
jgi:membrane protein YdbS with pleckstrin-like domain